MLSPAEIRTGVDVPCPLDGVKTYELTWAIREAGERSRAERAAKKKD